MPEEPHLRVSDQEREEAAAAIREHYAAGRLDSTEFEERVQAAYGARTQSELSALSADLPALPPKPPTKVELARQSFNTNVLIRNASMGTTAFLACTGIWALTGANGDFWPRWVLIFTLVTIVRGVSRGARGRGRYGGGGGGPYRGGRGQGRGPYYSYHYEYRYGDGPPEHEHHHEQQR